MEEAQTLRRLIWMAMGVARVPGLKQTGSNETGRVPSLSNQVHGAGDCVDSAWGGREGSTGQARLATSNSMRHAPVSIC